MIKESTEQHYKGETYLVKLDLVFVSEIGPTSVHQFVPQQAGLLGTPEGVGPVGTVVAGGGSCRFSSGIARAERLPKQAKVSIWKTVLEYIVDIYSTKVRLTV